MINDINKSNQRDVSIGIIYLVFFKFMKLDNHSQNYSYNI